MKNLLFSLFFSLHVANAEVSQEFYKWYEGNFEMPPEIQKAKTISELRPFLENKRSCFNRMAAVRRLGEIKGEKAIDLLLDVFNKEGYEVLRAPEGAPIVKLEIIRTLGRMQGNKAKSALLNILKTYWKEGPRSEKLLLSWWHDGDFTTVVPLTIETLSKWILDDNVFQLIREIAFSERVRKMHTTSEPEEIGVKAWKAYLKGKIKREKTNEKDSIKYLFDFIDKVEKEKIEEKTPEDLDSKIGLKRSKIKAAMFLRKEMIKECSIDTLLSLKKEFEQELDKEFRTKAHTVRYYEIRSKIDFLDRILEERKKEKY